MKIKVLIDGYYLSKPRGMGRYAQELINALENSPLDKYEVHVCVTSDTSLGYMGNYKNIKFHYYKKSPFPIWEQFKLPRIAKALKVDIVHAPYNTKPLIFNLNKFPTVTTIHDLMFLNKEHKVKGLYQQFGNLYRSFIVKTMMLTAKNENIITVSNTSKKEINKFLQAESDVVYTSVDYFYNSVENSIKKSVSYPYIYHVGGISPHKNTEKVIQAFKNSKIKDIKLLISGMPKDCELAEKYEDDQVIFTGWLKDYEIASLYKYAEFIIFPSLREGYGLPIVEAFKYQRPVITSNLEPMNEIAGHAALLINPDSVEEMTRAISNLYYDLQLREDLEKESRSRAELFASHVMASQVQDVYERVYVYEKSINS